MSLKLEREDEEVDSLLFAKYVNYSKHNNNRNSTITKMSSLVKLKISQSSTNSHNKCSYFSKRSSNYYSCNIFNVIISLVPLLLISSLVSLSYASNVFSNQFAVHIPQGDSKASEIAAKHGYTNLGQIGSLKNYYLFEHSKVQKRSIEMSHDHHTLLTDEPEVHWFEQQVEKKRVKRDFSYFDGGRGVGNTPSFYNNAQQPHSFSSLAPNSYFTDPLYKEQWYLTSGSKDGFDMNVQAAWKRGYSGKGVTVSILDDGIQTNHPDLILNYDPQASTDINDNDGDPSPQDNGDNKHGTRCAGEVAATAGNSICGVGVAFNASIGGVRMLDGTVNDAVEAKALGLNPDHIDIYSASWGPEDDGKTVDGPGPLARRAFIYGVTNGRRGLGSIFIWASGNGGRHVDSCNCDGYTNSIFTLSISSATQGGYKPWYLEECASTLATTYSSGTPTLDKSVATVDMDGRLRPDHICTVEHTGTSASAPLAAGIAALALEANRNLSWRDLQHLVVMTSRAEPLLKEEGWYVNGVQRKFSHKFGYGLMDAGAMVDLAVNWAGVPSQHICKSREIREDKEIPGSHLGKVKVYMDVDGCGGSNSEIRFLEHVQCKISLRFFPRGNLRILLTSPMGTTSVLLFERPRDVSSSNFDDWPFLSVHFWGEQAHGRWTLEIINSGSRRINQPGLLKKWQLILYGTDSSPVRSKGRALNSSPINSNGRQPLFQGPQPPTGSPVGPQQPLPQSHYDHVERLPPRYHVPPEYLYPSASEPLPQLNSPSPPNSNSGITNNGVTSSSSSNSGVAVSNSAKLRRRQCEHDYWVPDLGICVNDCPEGYYEAMSQSRECASCSTRCKYCYNSTSCTACEHNLVLFGTLCVGACPEGYFEADSSCESCAIGGCTSCAGPLGTTCLRCLSPLLLHSGNCVQNCPSGTRANDGGECVQCPIGCESCGESGECGTCEQGFKKEGTNCVKESDCPVGLYLDSGIGSCIGCSIPHCLTCESSTACISCSPNYLLFNGSCLEACRKGYYSVYGRECGECPVLCSECGRGGICSECREDGMLESGKCVPHCSNGYYNDGGVCETCHSGCSTCIGGESTDCVSCSTGYNYTRRGSCELGSSKLVNVDGLCGDGYWLDESDGSCQQCHPSCTRCSGGGGGVSCLSCAYPLRLDRGSRRCIECCSHGDDGDCCHCDAKRHAQALSTPYTHPYSGECHFVSRRVSESDERDLTLGKLSDSTVLSFFWLSVLILFVILAILYHQKRKNSRKNEFRTKNTSSYYTPVSLKESGDFFSREDYRRISNEDDEEEEFNLLKNNSEKTAFLAT